MPRGLSNWTYRDVIDFLREKGFVFDKPVGGSHEYWISSDGKFIVDVNKITGSESYPERTLESMIRASGIPKKEWRNWASK